jgi:hypothetical protein
MENFHRGEDLLPIHPFFVNPSVFIGFSDLNLMEMISFKTDLNGTVKPVE